jgi:hypothetical protein
VKNVNSINFVTLQLCKYSEVEIVNGENARTQNNWCCTQKTLRIMRAFFGTVFMRGNPKGGVLHSWQLTQQLHAESHRSRPLSSPDAFCRITTWPLVQRVNSPFSKPQQVTGCAINLGYVWLQRGGMVSQLSRRKMEMAGNVLLSRETQTDLILVIIWGTASRESF